VRIGIASSLVVLWVLLWGDASLANLMSGVAIAAALLLAFPGDRREDAVRFVIRPIAALRLIAWFLVQLVISNALIARVVISRRSSVRTGVVACPLRTSSSRLTTVITSMVALTPGTMIVEVGDEPRVLYVHVLKLDDAESVRASIRDLESRVLAAFGPLGLSGARSRRRNNENAHQNGGGAP
jgi:multicomponent Na+:H+ antiporter subunit E